MRPIIDRKVVSEVLFPRTDADYPAFTVMVSGSEKGKEIISTPRPWRIVDGRPTMRDIFLHGLEGKMKSLPVPFPGTIDLVKKTCDTWNQGQPRKIAEVQWSIE